MKKKAKRMLGIYFSFESHNSFKFECVKLLLLNTDETSGVKEQINR